MGQALSHSEAPPPVVLVPPLFERDLRLRVGHPCVTPGTSDLRAVFRKQDLGLQDTICTASCPVSHGAGDVNVHGK